MLQSHSPQVRLDSTVVTHFLPLEAALDAAVGGSVTIEVERGGVPITARLEVMDLHAVTPAALLQVAGSVLHSLSYQQVSSRRVTVRTRRCESSNPRCCVRHDRTPCPRLQAH